jgi:hypothetical protein
MKALVATLFALFGIYIIWGATAYVFDAKPSDGSTPYFWAAGVFAFGAMLIVGCKRFATWISDGIHDESVQFEPKFGFVLYRLLGLYILYSQMPEFVQVVFVLTGIDYRGAYGNLPPEFSKYATWKIFIHLIVIASAVALALVPKKIDAWLSKWDLS